jgi:septum site-determining protein MinD
MLAVAGGTGGCGKTTTALGIARALARRGRDPLVVGADTAMPDLHLRASVDPVPSTDAVAGGELDRVVHRPDSPGTAVLPAGSELTGSALARLRSWDGPVVVDCPPGCGEPAVAPLRGCDRTLLVTTASPGDGENARKTAGVARRVDAPPAATLVRTQGARPPEFARRLPDAGEVIRVPTVPDPLSDPRVRAAHARVVDALGLSG